MSASATTFFLSHSSLKRSKTRFSVVGAQLVAQPGHLALEGVAAAVLAQHQLALGQADGLRLHDLVGQRVLHHAVLVDAGLVREGVGADDRLVRLDRHAGVRADQAAGADDLGGVDVRVQPVDLRPGVQRHHHLFQRGVAGPLADAVDRHLDLPRAVLDRGQRVGRRQPQVVVAVRRDDHVLRARHVLPDAADQRRRTRPAWCSRPCRGCSAWSRRP